MSPYPLRIAVRHKFLEVVQLLVEHRADVNMREEGRTPYEMAESDGLTEIARLLLEHYAEKE